jgi:hypothetical protein
LWYVLLAVRPPDPNMGKSFLASSQTREPVRGKRGISSVVVPGGHVLSITMTNSTHAEQEIFGEEICKAIASQSAPFSVILDLRALHDYPANQREIYANVRQRVRAVYERYHRLTVYVVESDKQRGFVTAVGWKATASATSGRTFAQQWSEAFELCRRSLE